MPRAAVTIKIAVMDIRPAELAHHPTGAREVRVFFRGGTGSGIKQRCCAYIEPFFTTKAVGKGTAWLATVYGIVKHTADGSRGKPVGKGTDFHVLLPAINSGA